MAGKFDFAELQEKCRRTAWRLGKNFEAIIAKYESCNDDEDDTIDLKTLTIAKEGKREMWGKSDDESSEDEDSAWDESSKVSTPHIKADKDLEARGLSASCPELMMWMSTYEEDTTDGESLTSEDDSDSDILWEDDDDDVIYVDDSDGDTIIWDEQDDSVIAKGNNEDDEVITVHGSDNQEVTTSDEMESGSAFSTCGSNSGLLIVSDDDDSEEVTTAGGSDSSKALRGDDSINDKVIDHDDDSNEVILLSDSSSDETGLGLSNSFLPKKNDSPIYNGKIEDQCLPRPRLRLQGNLVQGESPKGVPDSNSSVKHAAASIQCKQEPGIRGVYGRIVSTATDTRSQKQKSGSMPNLLGAKCKEEAEDRENEGERASSAAMLKRVSGSLMTFQEVQCKQEPDERGFFREPMTASTVVQQGHSSLGINPGVQCKQEPKDREVHGSSASAVTVKKQDFGGARFQVKQEPEDGGRFRNMKITANVVKQEFVSAKTFPGVRCRENRLDSRKAMSRSPVVSRKTKTPAEPESGQAQPSANVFDSNMDLSPCMDLLYQEALRHLSKSTPHTLQSQQVSGTSMRHYLCAHRSLEQVSDHKSRREAAPRSNSLTSASTCQCHSGKDSESVQPCRRDAARRVDSLPGFTLLDDRAGRVPTPWQRSDPLSKNHACDSRAGMGIAGQTGSGREESSTKASWDTGSVTQTTRARGNVRGNSCVEDMDSVLPQSKRVCLVRPICNSSAEDQLKGGKSAASSPAKRCFKESKSFLPSSGLAALQLSGSPATRQGMSSRRSASRSANQSSSDTPTKSGPSSPSGRWNGQTRSTLVAKNLFQAPSSHLSGSYSNQPGASPSRPPPKMDSMQDSPGRFTEDRTLLFQFSPQGHQSLRTSSGRHGTPPTPSRRFKRITSE